MKHLSLFIALFICTSATATVAETTKKTILIDNMSKIEQSYNDITKILDLNLISDNAIPFDEQYAETCIAEALSDFISTTNLTNYELTYSRVNPQHEGGKYTSVDKKYRFSDSE